ncbi:ABC transporter ATP-binding protein [Zunongwangia sp. F363]|uniref:ABC transporter ATP-binding protein n=1 Tax=Autumnicola tepida TaxID=3075595 RepID=A0ABU3C9P2_9FLAO|nr:ABC transporter ATP-binding protein [Zunongwangia sp. F363]MDT0643054.1 ABC transporter ATP-binding protein [Zunongwangia sp. F363]
MSIILKAENISKQYRLGTVGTGTLSHDLNRWWHRVRGKEDPYLKIGALNNRSTKATEDYVWALRDINFEVKQGEVLGIIGKNGAGKSTLLKILSRVTAPSTGSIKTKGRIASLLEVGTGFHGELTGRENIFMNGAVLGMNKAEIKRKLDEIIAFSGCEKYIDTPVKRYSSGMTVRLGFAVAAHLEPEILVVDEVLAVGDAEFQKKAIGKMQDLSTGEGRTVLFVSHNMASVKTLCKRGILLENGSIQNEGNIEETVEYYLKQEEKSSVKEIQTDKYIKNFTVFNEKGEATTSFLAGKKCEIRIDFRHISIGKNIGIGLYIKKNKEPVTGITTFMNPPTFLKGNNRITLYIEELQLSPGIYNIDIALADKNRGRLSFIQNISQLKIENNNVFNSTEGLSALYGNFYLKTKWLIEQ